MIKEIEKLTKYYFAKFKKLKWLLYILILLALLFLYFGLVFEGKSADFWINMAASFFGLLGVIVIVDVLLEMERKRELQEAYNIAKDDLLHLGNKLFTYVREPLGVKFLLEEISPRENLEDRVGSIIRKLLIYTQENIGMLLGQMKTKDWQRLQMNLVIIKSDLSETINLYKEILPPNVLGKILALKNAYESFYSIFGLATDLFINEEKDWPPNKFGSEQNQQIRSALLKSFEHNLKTYFSALKIFFDVLDEWKSEN